VGHDSQDTHDAYAPVTLLLRLLKVDMRNDRLERVECATNTEFFTGPVQKVPLVAQFVDGTTVEVPDCMRQITLAM
jgi:hypothetical protein